MFNLIDHKNYNLIMTNVVEIIQLKMTGNKVRGTPIKNKGLNKNKILINDSKTILESQIFNHG